MRYRGDTARFDRNKPGSTQRHEPRKTPTKSCISLFNNNKSHCAGGAGGGAQREFDPQSEFLSSLRQLWEHNPAVANNTRQNLEIHFFVDSKVINCCDLLGLGGFIIPNTTLQEGHEGFINIGEPL